MPKPAAPTMMTATAAPAPMPILAPVLRLSGRREAGQAKRSSKRTNRKREGGHQGQARSEDKGGGGVGRVAQENIFQQLDREALGGEGIGDKTRRQHRGERQRLDHATYAMCLEVKKRQAMPSTPQLLRCPLHPS